MKPLRIVMMKMKDLLNHNLTQSENEAFENSDDENEGSTDS